MKNSRRSPGFRPVGLVLVAIASLCMLASGAAAASQTDALDRSGNLYQVRSLLVDAERSESAGVPEGTPVLTLDVTPADGETVRLLVPGSLGAEVDEEFRIHLDQRTTTAYVVWIASGESTDEVRIAAYRGGVWTVARAISSPWSASRENLVSYLQLEWIRSADGSSSQLVPILHTAWWDDADGVRYAPVFFGSDGLVAESSLTVFSAEELVELDGSGGCSSTETPDAARHPALVSGVLSGAMADAHIVHLDAYSREACRFLIIPLRFGVAEETGPEVRQTRFIPLIGVATEIDAAALMANLGDDSRFDAAKDGSTGGYAAILSWIDSEIETVLDEDGNVLEEVVHQELDYSLYDPALASWIEVRRIPLGSDLTSDDARALARALIGAE